MSDSELLNSIEKHKIWQAGFDAGFKAGFDEPRDWTPCAEGLPTNDGAYDVTLENKAGTRIAITGYWSDGAWVQVGYEKLNIIAWMPKPAPYNPDRKEDAK